MKIRVRLFGPLAEQAGKASIELVVDGTTVRDIVGALVVAAPELKVDPSVRFAVNTDYAEPSTTVKEGDVVSLIPPVGGG